MKNTEINNSGVRRNTAIFSAYLIYRFTTSNNSCARSCSEDSLNIVCTISHSTTPSSSVSTIHETHSPTSSIGSSLGEPPRVRFWRFAFGHCRFVLRVCVVKVSVAFAVFAHCLQVERITNNLSERILLCISPSVTISLSYFFSLVNARIKVIWGILRVIQR